MLRTHIKHAIAVLTFTTMLASPYSVSNADDNTVDLDSWLQSIEAVHSMQPKWGKQGVDAFKATVDAGVPIIFLDVRTPAEWEQGVLKDALTISLTDLPKAEFVKQLPEDRGAIIGIYCKSGHRSALALPLLHQLGYENAISMEGGFVAWLEAEYPVEEYKNQ